MESSIKLRPYQVATIKKAATALTTSNKVIVVLPTGAGKSIVIAYVANNITGRTLVLTHRAEILSQNSEWLNNFGTLTRKENNVRLDHKVVIAMVQTLHARVKKHGVNYIGSFDNIIVDEAHIDIYQKVYTLYNPKRLIGFTATPCMSKRELIELDGIEYYRTITLKDQYDVLVEGVSVPELIIQGHLVEDENYQLELPNMGDLEDSNTNPDGYTTDSLTKVYSNTASLKILWEAYEKYGKGKKVLLFNATTAINPIVQNLFTSKGIANESFDSVNSNGKDRNRVIKWFDNTRDAVLIGTNVFTTGFNVPDIEVVIVNRATKSLALWIQMVGRGSRTTTKIFKNKFLVLDLGQNIARHGLWSDKIDWMGHFEPGSMIPRIKKDIMMIWECRVCGAYNALADLTCVECNAAKCKPETVKKPDKTGVIVEVPKTIFPRSKRIIEYTKANGENATFAFKLLDERILDLFKQHNVTKSHYTKMKQEFHDRVKQIYVPIYFGIINAKLGGKRRKLDTQLEGLYNKIDEYYERKTD